MDLKTTDLVEARARTDLSLSDERAKTDRVLDRELPAIESPDGHMVEQEEHAAVAHVVEQERAETNARLQTEREGADDVADHAGSLLFEEKSAHDSSKIAIARRDEFLAIVSHDLRSPLTSIGLNVDLMMHDVPDDERGRTMKLCAMEVQVACAQMSHLISDLVDAASIEAGRIKVRVARGDARRLIEEAIEASAPMASAKSVVLAADVLPEPILARFDHARLLQVFSNLAGNAIKFSKVGDTIVLGAKKQEDALRFFVRDMGCGIAAADLPHVFDRFWQLGKNDRRGLGLGLYICKAIVEAHGGKIGVTSAVGRGSTFFFTLG